MQRVYICIPVHNRLKYTIECIESILKQNYKNYEVIITDDGSTDGTTEMIKSYYPEVVVLNGDGNLWWSGATNKCIDYVLTVAQNGDFVFTLNNDTKVQKDTIDVLVKNALRNKSSIISAINVFESDGISIEPSAQKKRSILGIDFPKKVNSWGESIKGYSGLVEVDSLSGKGVLIPINVFKDIGLYNSVLLPHYHADTEFTFRAKRNGYKILLCYDAKVLSHQHLSGLGTRTSKPNVSEFIKSFNTIKSTHHFNSLKNRAMLNYGKKYRVQLGISLGGIILGFLKRYLYERVIKSH